MTKVRAKSKAKEPAAESEKLVKVQWFVRPIHDEMMRARAAQNKRNISSQVQVELDGLFDLDKDGRPAST